MPSRLGPTDHASPIADAPSPYRFGLSSRLRDPSRFVGGMVLAFFVGAVFVMANWPMRYVEANPQWIGKSEFKMLPVQQLDRMPTMAGWPLRYHIHVDDGMAGQPRYWSWFNLFGNVVIASGCMSAVIGLVWLRSDWIDRSTDPGRSKKRFEIGLAIGVLVLPLLMLAPVAIGTYRQNQLIQRLSANGNVFRSSWMPAPIADQLPRGVVRLFSRIRRVQLSNPDESTVRVVVGLKELIQFDSNAGTFDASLLGPLSDRPHFSALTLSRHQIGKPEWDVIDRLPWLQALSLADSKVDTAMIPRVGSVAGLQTINLAKTNVPLSSLEKPAWSETIQTVILTRPRDGFGDSLTIDGWPELQTLVVARSDRGMNDNELRLKLVDLPRLSRLSLDRLQLHALEFRNLPLLTRINDDSIQVDLPDDDERWLPAMDWYSEVVLENLPSLTRLTCFVRDVTKVRLRNLTSLHDIELCSYLTSSFGGDMTQPTELDRCRDWIREIGQCKGPHRLMFKAMPIGDVDLRPLVNNAAIHELEMEECGVQFDGIRRLASMRQLTSIGLGECEIGGDQLDWFVRQFPNLETLRINGGNLRRIELTGDGEAGGRLKKLEVSRLRKIESLRIIDRPELVASLRIESPIGDLVLRDARRIEGLVMTEPWPASASVDGLRDLRWFAAGGRHVDDDLVDTLLRCPKMDQLTLAYPGISREGLRRLGDFRLLTILTIPGAGIDDEIVSHWSNLQSLWEVNFDDSRIGDATIAWLCGIPSLRSVSLNNTPLDAEARSLLCELRQITALRLRNCPLTTDDALALLGVNSLEIVDLSGCDVDANAVIERASRSAGLRALILNGAAVDESVLQKALATNPRLAIDLRHGRERLPGNVPGENVPGENVPGTNVSAANRSAFVATLDSENLTTLTLALPDDFTQATKTELSQRLLLFLRAVGQAQGVTLRNQMADPATSTMMSHKNVSMDAPRRMRRRGRRSPDPTAALHLFAISMDSARIDLDYMRRAAKRQSADDAEVADDADEALDANETATDKADETVNAAADETVNETATNAETDRATDTDR